MGRVNLDQLELIKDQESSCEEEDERDMMEMVGDENVARMEDKEEEEEEEEQEVMASIQEEREMDDEEMEGIKEEEEEQEEDVRDETAEERPPVHGRMIVNKIIYLIFLELRAMQTPFPRSPCVSHRQLRSERRGEASPLRVLWPLLHQQPGVGASRPAPRHVSLVALCTRLSGLPLVFAQTRGGFSWVCVCGRIPDICVRQTGMHTCLLSLLSHDR